MLTIPKIERRAGKLQKSYKKRPGRRSGRRPDKSLFIFFAAYSLFKEKYPERRIIFNHDPEEWNLQRWLEEKYEQYYNDNENCFAWERLYKWKAGKPFREMQWGITWDDVKTIYEISCNGASKGEMSSRNIQRKHGISKKELEDWTGFILSQHACNKKISNKFIFDRSDK